MGLYDVFYIHDCVRVLVDVNVYLDVHMCPGCACVYMEVQVWPFVYRDIDLNEVKCIIQFAQ